MLVQRWNYWLVFRVTTSRGISSQKRCHFFAIFLSSKANAKSDNKSAWRKSSATRPLSKTSLPVGQLSRCPPILQSEHGSRFNSWNVVLFSLYLTWTRTRKKQTNLKTYTQVGTVKWILHVYERGPGTGLIWLRIVKVASSCGHINEPSGCIRRREITIYNKPTRCNSGSIVFINNYRYALHVSDALCFHHQEHYKL